LIKKLNLFNRENVEVSYTIRAGNMVDEILTLSEEHDFDVIYLGEDNNTFTRLFGDEPSRIIKHRLRIPVKVINPEGKEL